MEVNLKKKVLRSYTFQIDKEDIQQRLDIFLTEKLHGFSRSLIQKYIQKQKEPVVLVNSTKKKSNYRLQQGDTVTVDILEPEKITLEPVEIPLHILYEDDYLLVLDKQPGVPVHPSYGHENDTIVNALLHYFWGKKALSSIGGEKRPGIVHRLDKDTAGILLIAKNDHAHAHLSLQFSSRSMEKIYEAIVKGDVYPERGVINKPIVRNPRNRKKYITGEGGRESITIFSVIDRKNETSWVKFIPKTGRTHQIRVHAQSIGHPIIGDSLYTRKSHPTEYIALVAKEMTFVHPFTEKPVSFSAPYPKHFINLATSLGYKIK